MRSLFRKVLRCDVRMPIMRLMSECDRAISLRFSPVEEYEYAVRFGVATARRRLFFPAGSQVATVQRMQSSISHGTIVKANRVLQRSGLVVSITRRGTRVLNVDKEAEEQNLAMLVATQLSSVLYLFYPEGLPAAVLRRAFSKMLTTADLEESA